MSYRFTDFPYLLNRQPQELKHMILAAVRACNGNVRDASEYVGLTRRQFYKYAGAVNALAEMQEIRDEFRRGRVAQPRRLDLTEFGTLARTDPKEAQVIMQMAFADSTSAPEAAEKLGISARRFYAYVRQWNLFPDIQTDIAKRMQIRREWLARRQQEANHNAKNKGPQTKRKAGSGTTSRGL